MSDKINILIVDDAPENLLALESVLDPLGHNLVRASSGAEALRHLLVYDFALILMDVQMPILNGFQTVELIKEREKSKMIPIIFLTAIDKESEHMFKGYSVGAVDYLFKPFEPVILRSKVSVFVDLYQKNQQIMEQSELLEKQAREDVRTANKRLEFLADASRILNSSLNWSQTAEEVASLITSFLADGCVIEILQNEKQQEDAICFGHKDPYGIQLLKKLTHSPINLISSHTMKEIIKTKESLFLPQIDHNVLVSDRDEEELLIIQQLDVSSAIVTPIVSDDEVIGIITFFRTQQSPVYDQTDFALAKELMIRASSAIQNAQLYQAVQQQANAALALEHTADGVFLTDTKDHIRYFNRAAELITGLAMDDVLGEKATDAIPGWSKLKKDILAAKSLEEQTGSTRNLPFEVNGRELWLSVNGVDFGEGIVYAFRDLTQDQALEQMRTDLIATISHEIRTPLTGIYGAVVTLRRDDIDLSDDIRDEFLSMIEEQSERLKAIVDDILTASYLDSGKLDLAQDTVDVVKMMQTVVNNAKPRAEADINLIYDPPAKPQLVKADNDKLQQVFVNLVENAIKYSPDGGDISMSIESAKGKVKVYVCDSGMGIPPAERERIFEKFYRLDPNQAKGVGGTGLGLYISSELIKRMRGKIGVKGNRSKGSTFWVELPAAEKKD